MILCPVCNTQNHHLAIACTSCGSYLQTKVEALDLFTTAWNVLEKPQKAFHTIAVAQHKNYSFFLSAIAGIAYTFFLFWIIKAGDAASSLINFLVAGFAISPLIGIFSLLIVSILIVLLARVSNRVIKLWNAFAVLTYSQVPIVISVILVLPLEIMTFGIYFFGSNPSPYQLKPSSYILLLMLDGIFGVWSLILLWAGVKKLTDAGWLYSLIILLIALCFYVGIVTGSYYLIQPHMR